MTTSFALNYSPIPPEESYEATDPVNAIFLFNFIAFVLILVAAFTRKVSRRYNIFFFILCFFLGLYSILSPFVYAIITADSLVGFG